MSLSSAGVAASDIDLRETVHPAVDRFFTSMSHVDSGLLTMTSHTDVSPLGNVTSLLKVPCARIEPFLIPIGQNADP